MNPGIENVIDKPLQLNQEIWRLVQLIEPTDVFPESGCHKIKSMRLVVPLVLAYLLAIIYASLEPFEGWRWPLDPLFGFVTAPWPRYTIASDIVLNIVAYLPFGALLYVALQPKLSPADALWLAILLGAALSFTLESIQMFLPARIASNVDLLTNIIGATIGALAAKALWQPLWVMARRWLRADWFGDAGATVIALWIIAQLYPMPFALGTGDLREALNLAPAFTHSPESYIATQAIVAALFTVAVGLLISLSVQPQRAPLLAIAMTLLCAFIDKSLAMETLTSVNGSQWITPGVVLGLIVSMFALLVVVRQPPQVRAVIAMACLVGGAITVNIAPGNPYQTLPVFMLPPEITHLARFGHIILALSVGWPLLAIIYFAWALAHRDALSSSDHRL